VTRYLTKLNTNRLAAFDRAAKDTAMDEEFLTLTETLRLSEAALTPEQRTVWRALSVFPAPFDERAALAVAGADEETLKELLHRSLVEKEKTRLKLHDLAAEYAQRELGANAVEEKWRAYVAHYTAVAREAQDAYLAGGEKVLEGLRLFDAERAHVEAAFVWLKDRTDRPSAQTLVELVYAFVHMSDLRFHPRQQILWLEAQLRSARETGDRRAEGVALTNLGVAHADLGDARKAIEYYGQSLTILREIGDRRAEGATLNNLGTAHRDLGDTRMAIEYYGQSLPILRETGDRRGEGATLGNLGLAHRALGDARKAIEYYEQDLAICRETGDRRGEGQTLGNLGVAYKTIGDARKAIEYYGQQLVIVRETGDRRGEGAALGNLGVAYKNLGDAREAIEYYGQQLVIVRETGDRRGEGTALWNSALLLEQQGDRQEAISRVEAALRIYEAIEDPNAAKVRRALEELKASPET
jgi:tetratricopeptide (TPR) repeat protein